MSSMGAAAGFHEALANLRKASSSIAGKFSCGGVLKPMAPTRLWFTNRNKSEASSKTLEIPASPLTLAPLLKSCQPATFGLGSKTVLDESVRKALQLPPQDFCCNFNLAAHRILDDVRDALLYPGQGVTAELYKLNVYGVGDHFKPHVDTPRGDNMFGSLVVCLPQPFEGGQLAVRHAGREVVYDWAERVSGSNAAPNPELQWAAFFADCEHEILPVTSGHRLTLTYLLRSHSDDGTEYDGVRPFAAADPCTLPLFHELTAALASPDFMPDGGWLGFACQHAYVFTEDIADQLKGADRLLWLTLTEAGLDLQLKAQIDLWDADTIQGGQDDDDDYDDTYPPWHTRGASDSDASDSDDDDGDDFYDGGRGGAPDGAVSTLLASATVGDIVHVRPDYEASVRRIPREFGWKWRKVVWVTQNRGKGNLYATYVSYGNEPSVSSLYASVAILARVLHVDEDEE